MEAKQAVLVMRQKLDERFFNANDDTKNLLKAKPVLMSTVLSPGGSKLFKAFGRMTGDAALYERAMAEVHLLCERTTKNSLQTPRSGSPATAALPPRAGWSVLTDFMDEEDSVDAAPSGDTSAAILRAELEESVNVPASSKPGDPLAFWWANMGRFWTLHLVACAVLGAVGSSAASERDFSQAGSTMRKERSRMLAEHLEMHCLIKDNAGLLPRQLDSASKLSVAEAADVRASMPISEWTGDSESSSDEHELVT
ncbi:hypothetical protein MMPV_008447 [Pyropia vietnamensis]